MTELQS